MTWQDWDKAVTALCIWREARGETTEGQIAVAWVIKNRAIATAKPWHEIVQHKWQFSSMTAPRDGQIILWPQYPDIFFEWIMEMLEGVYNGSTPDPTLGATHYFNPSVVLPSWASNMVKTASIGHHDFYK